MSVLQKAKDHFAGMERLEIEVPEWGTENKPLKIFSNPVTLKDRKICLQKAGGENLEFFAYLLIRMAEDEKGEKLFKAGDKADLIYRVDSRVLIRLGAQILRAEEEEDLAKK